MLFLVFRLFFFLSFFAISLGFLEWVRSPISYSSNRSLFLSQSHKNLSTLLEDPDRQILSSDKVLICGIGRNVAKASSNTIHSIQTLGRFFSDYRVIIYENNSTDKTREIYSSLAKKDPRVFFLSEKLSRKRLDRFMKMKVRNRTEQIARARNLVLDIAMDPAFHDYKYVIWADLDFETPWKVEEIVKTITEPQEEWDAVLAYGAYDLFALRSAKWPIGFELVGDLYWKKLDPIRKEFVLDSKDGKWERVYSAFGGIGIYKRESMQGCRYSGVVTKSLERSVLKWISKAKEDAKNQKEIYLFDEYQNLVAHHKPVLFSGNFLRSRSSYPDEIGIQMHFGNVVWFSCTSNTTLPWTCEHVCFHAEMALRGKDKIFINPRIVVDP
jgi:glycosyltransferase involved in cell wall biosynthesis